jgi:predicted nucleic acid-binding protein
MVGEQPESNYATINIITELCNHALKKTIKNTVQKDTQIHEAQIITEKLNIILDNIKISVPFIFQIIFYQQKESCHC